MKKITTIETLLFITIDQTVIAKTIRVLVAQLPRFRLLVLKMLSVSEALLPQFRLSVL
jgi:hypothetical protein